MTLAVVHLGTAQPSPNVSRLAFDASSAPFPRSRRVLSRLSGI